MANRKRDAVLEFEGVKMDMSISASECPGVNGTPKYRFYIVLRFPDRDWGDLMRITWDDRPYKWDYKVHVSIRLDCGPCVLPKAGPPRYARWKLRVEAYEYVLSGYYECNKSGPTSLRFRPECGEDRIKSAVLKLLREQPDLLSRAVASDYDAKVKERADDVKRARQALRSEERELADARAKARKHRPEV